MPRVILKPFDEEQRTVLIRTGRTILGRGPFLNITDMKVSRHHAMMDVLATGELVFTPLHKNPCCFKPSDLRMGKLLQKGHHYLLSDGDSFSLIPRAHKYEIILVRDFERIPDLPGLNLSASFYEDDSLESFPPSSSSQNPDNALQPAFVPMNFFQLLASEEWRPD